MIFKLHIHLKEQQYQTKRNKNINIYKTLSQEKLRASQIGHPYCSLKKQ
jgi:hypothetical protein